MIGTGYVGLVTGVSGRSNAATQGRNCAATRFDSVGIYFCPKCPQPKGVGHSGKNKWVGGVAGAIRPQVAAFNPPGDNQPNDALPADDLSRPCGGHGLVLEQSRSKWTYWRGWFRDCGPNRRSRCFLAVPGDVRGTYVFNGTSRAPMFANTPCRMARRCSRCGRMRRKQGCRAGARSSIPPASGV